MSGLLTVNAGSTSLKLSLVADDGTAVPLTDLATALAGDRPDAVVHRVVHGGSRDRAALVDDALLRELRDLTELAPLHQPAALDAIDRARRAWPDVPHVACFDTAFHRTMPAAASTYALPAHLRERVRVHGFHGLSHSWSAGRAALHAPAARRVVVAHLGGGASLCAVRDGQSIETTMGFTPLDGLVMGSRSGHVDPGALLWLLQHTDEDLTDLLERRSGLVGLAGSSDLQEVLRRRDSGDADAALAVEVYLHRLTTHVGMMVAALQGLDVVVLTGGVGEHSLPVRAALADRLAWLGVALTDDPPAAADDGVVDLSSPGARVRTLLVPAREDLQMAAEARALLG